ncbi:uncharacterized protein LOC115985888 [Quercus lobata]|nr:uncharacterized protein LOC115985888 [Quercus lobata]
MYAKMRAKKDEPLASIGKKVVRVTGKGSSAVDATPIVPGVEGVRVASPATSVEEIPTPSSKRPRISAKDKEKEKTGSSIFDDEGVAVERAHNIVKAEDLKVFSGVPVNVVASQHVHKIMQVLGESLHLASECLTQEARVASLTSRMEALEKENSALKKDLIQSMDESATLKEKVKALNSDLRVERQLNLEKDDQLQATKEKLKTVAASWYFKGFELLRRYLVKYPTGVDLPSLDLEVVDQVMAADEAAQPSAPDSDAPAADDAPPAAANTVTDAPDARA